MTQSIRQSELFAGNDWLAIYRAFTDVNLNASDFTTIRSAMVDYIRLNYPEDFNDWIESSEFVALIDLLAYLGQNLAFRTDINARENFLDLARRRESVLRLARSLSYNAKRAYPARGLAKLTSIVTTQDVHDSAGNNLANRAIRWDDANNPDWFEQWILVLNSSLVQTNPFGIPLKNEPVLGTQTQLYRFNSIPVSAGNYPFSANVSNRTMSFDAVNPDFDKTFGFKEQAPDPSAAFHIIYRSDGNGNSSPDTGFFVYIKQGTLQRVDYSITEPQENRAIPIQVPNINETDVWVQSVDDNGFILPKGNWTRVGHTPSDDNIKVLLTTENVSYNNIDPDISNVFQVVTRQDDEIMLRFGDGRFGTSPTGNLRVWFRTSANGKVVVRPDEISNSSISMPYTSHRETEERLTISFSLRTPLNNGVGSETNDEIRRRASKVYSTQGRMVSGADYNHLPVQTNIATKLKAVNRVYSGQSRYIDLNDPTGTYQNTNVFGDDGALYLEDDPQIVEVAHAVASEQEVLNRYVKGMVESVALRDFMLNRHYQDPDNFGNTFHTGFLQDSNLVRQMNDRLLLGQTFGLGFNPTEEAWYLMDSSDMVVSENMVGGDFPEYEFSPDFYLNGDSSWLIYVEFNADFWRIYCRGLAYVFESERTCKFFFVNDVATIDPNTGKAGIDTIRLLKKPNDLSSHLNFRLEKPYIYSDGYVDPNKVRVRMLDGNADGVYDHPNSYYLVGGDTSIIVHQLVHQMDGYVYERLVRELASPQEFPLPPMEYGYLVVDNQVKLYRGQENNINVVMKDNLDEDLILDIGNTYEVANQQFRIRNGANQLVFQWKHFAPSTHRIDPAVSNIIDMFVLTRDYHDEMVAWRNAGAIPTLLPAPPSELELQQTFQSLAEFKMFSDEMIWRPVKFKLLFGESAEPELRAKFKLVKMAGSPISDGEIKAKVIDCLANFFDVNIWDFGETFYFSELAAYIHRQLSTSISSVEIVPVQGIFGKLREIRCQPDELFFTAARVGDIEIISANTPTNLRIR